MMEFIVESLKSSSHKKQNQARPKCICNELGKKKHFGFCF